MKEVNDFTKLNMMSNRRSTIATIFFHNSFHTIKFTMMFLSLQCTDHLFDEIIHIAKFHDYVRVINLDGETISNIITKGSYG